MEITNNQSKTLTLEVPAAAKVSVVSKTENSNVARIASQPDSVSENQQPVLQETSTVEKQQQSEEQAENLHVAVSQMNDHVQNLQRNLQFSVDEKTGKEVVTVIDKVSEEVIRQIPSEEALALAHRLAENKEDRVQLFSTLA